MTTEILNKFTSYVFSPLMQERRVYLCVNTYDVRLYKYINKTKSNTTVTIRVAMSKVDDFKSPLNSSFFLV